MIFNLNKNLIFKKEFLLGKGAFGINKKCISNYNDN